MNNHEELRRLAMRSLEESRLENVCDTAYALNANGFTPNYSAITLDLPTVAGFQLRLTGAFHSLINVPYGGSDDDVRAATRNALRRLMVGLAEQSKAWLDANPEETAV
jgi:hypothetical protein